MNKWLNYHLLQLFLSAVEGSGEPELCPAGTFSPLSGLTSEVGCQPCTAGFYCRGVGLRAPTGPCSQGTFFFVNHWYCKTWNVSANCLIKVWYIFFKASFLPFCTLLSCVSCYLIGYWCPPGQTVATALPCPPGHYCPQGSAAPEPCPSGTYQRREKQEACTVCEAGKSCPFWFKKKLS